MIKKGQKGSASVFAAISLSVLVIMLSLADIGLLYYYDIEYQKAADLAAIAGARDLYDEAGLQSCGGTARPAAELAAANNLGGKNYQIVVTCGRWRPFETPRLDTGGDVSLHDTVEVVISGTPPGVMPFIATPQISRRATATISTPQAALNIRSTVATLQDGVVNALLGALLGSNVALTVVGWDGVANVNVSLLEFLDNVAFLEGIDVDLEVGGYDALLDAEVDLLNLIQAQIEAVGSGSTAGVVLSAFGAQLLSLGLPPLPIRLGDLLTLQTGGEASGLNLGLNAFDLLQALVQVASQEHALAADVGVNVPGLLGIRIAASVVEPPQISVIGNPALIDPADPKGGERRIYVRTAQVRALVSVDLGVIGFLNKVLDALPLLDLQVLDSDLDVGVDVGGAEAYVTGYECALNGDKALEVDTETALARLAIGTFSAADLNDFFGSGTPFPDADVLNILSLKVLGIPVAEIGIAANVPVAGSSRSLTYSATPANPDPLPEIGAAETAAMYQNISAQDIVGSLTDTLAGLELEVKVLNSGLLGNLLEAVLGVVGALLGSLLSPLLDPVLNGLLDLLGVNLANAEIGARLSCNLGVATLVE
ncbi:pilus assembly protein TadG-related protein [Sinimarinibacterium flocculans]|uniref:Aspartate carbamoyltransferase n=1 Tax=Sinimarinibacterium flocculans TaxID=985250 RepID=A0A318E5X3_9GAMM|nr:pilus assembly protein TadG-related protein [Sinimarinibacterium flocculans]PXV64212.1 aspartate carbamoyltransferase [Sinimarinibacterium flocculans]